MEETEKILRRAVRDLREALGLTQVQFPQRLRKSYATVQRYETAKAPNGLALVDLVVVAKEAARFDLADIFRQAFWGRLPAKFTEDFQLEIAAKGQERPRLQKKGPTERHIARS